MAQACGELRRAPRPPACRCAASASPTTSPTWPLFLASDAASWITGETSSSTAAPAVAAPPSGSGAATSQRCDGSAPDAVRSAVDADLGRWRSRGTGSVEPATSRSRRSLPRAVRGSLDEHQSGARRRRQALLTQCRSRQVGGGGRRRDHEGHDPLAPLRVGSPGHGHLGHAGMAAPARARPARATRSRRRSRSGRRAGRAPPAGRRRHAPRSPVGNQPSASFGSRAVAVGPQQHRPPQVDLAVVGRCGPRRRRAARRRRRRRCRSRSCRRW